MNIKKVITIVAVLLLTVSVKAQQDPQYTQYMYNMNIVNPGYAGSLDYLSVNFLARTQWVGIDGAPKTITLGVHSPVGKRVGLGLSLIADKLGPVEEQNLYGDFSYTLQLSERGKLALGLKAGVTLFKADLNSLVSYLTEANDPLFIDHNINKALPNFGVGAFYYTDRFYIGLSIPNLLETLHFERSGGQLTKAVESKHYFLTSGYVFKLTETIKFKPSTMIKIANNTPLSVDVSANFLFNDRFEFGLSHRLNESVSTLINFRARENLRIGYAYDYTLTHLGRFNSGTHEVFLLFNFDFERDKIKSPRFF